MTLRTLFKKQVFIRLTDDQTAFIYTAKWPLLSRIRRVGVSEAGRNFAPQVTEPGSIAREAFPMLRQHWPGANE
jgi:hypothetical protein